MITEEMVDWVWNRTNDVSREKVEAVLERAAQYAALSASPAGVGVETPPPSTHLMGRTVAPVEVYQIIKDVVIDKENASFWSRRIATALSSQSAQTETNVGLLAQVASIICEETCGLTSLCKSREAAKALLEKGYLKAPAPLTREVGE